ncbi:MAG TPA: tetratricopeptide repeat protein [Campylobacteraceae bacterium]|nr:tetratricopeptide repeat protein [Campylobacteraceae bacterium]
MSTLTLARIYEKQGHLADALQIYREHLRKNPEDRELRAAVLRLKHINTKALKYFMEMHSEAQFLKFEKWLAKSWN